MAHIAQTVQYMRLFSVICLPSSKCHILLVKEKLVDPGSAGNMAVTLK